MERSAAHRKIQVRRVMGQPSQPLAACHATTELLLSRFPGRCSEGLHELRRRCRPRTLFPSHGRTRRLADVRDDPTSTLMIVESVNTSIHWMEPRDLEWDRMSFSVNDRSRPSISSEHRVGAQGTSRARSRWWTCLSGGFDDPCVHQGLVGHRRWGVNRSSSRS